MVTAVQPNRGRHPSSERQRSPWVRYGIALVSVALAIGVRTLLTPLWGLKLPFITLYPAVLLSAWYGGMGPGFVTTVLCILAADYLWIPPLYSLAVTDVAEGVGLLLATGFLLLIVFLIEERRKALTAVERQVQDRVAEFEHVNAMLRAEITVRKQAEEALKANEERYRQMFENNHAVKLLIDPASGAIVDANPAAAEFYGYSQEELRRMQIAQINLLPAERVTAEMARAVAAQRTHFLFRHRLASGEVRDVEVYSSPFIWEGQRLLYSIIHDITERRQAEEALRALNAELEQRVAERTAEFQRSNEEFQQFGYIVSHDLQEPLRTVTSFLQLLAQRYQGKLDTEAEEFITFARDSAQRMQTLIQDLLTYSRVGGRDLTFTAVDSEAILAQILSDLQVAITDTQAEVTHDPLPTVRGDVTQFRLVLQNLISNALKFRSAAPPRIHISARQEEASWVFAVRDNGIGIDPQHAERIFQVFQRLHPRSAYPGTGIGLAICKKIVERHGGRIWVESTPGQGATFFFALPENG